jgi:hypothetical protein
VEFPLQDGGTVLVQVGEAAAGPATRGLSGQRLVTGQAQQTFEQAITRVQPTARSLIARLQSVADPPDEVGIEFGVQLSAQSGALIASVVAEANFTVSMTWRRRGGTGG